MPLRGSAQLLLLFLRAHSKRGWIMGAIAGGAVAAGVSLGAGAVPLPTAAELAQALRESAWDRALAEAPATSPWPWADVPATTGKVARLGLSAAMVKEGRSHSMRAVDEPLRPAAAAAPQKSGTMLSKLAVGDRITVTTASGDSRVYRVTGPKVVDPHLAEGGSQAVSGDACVPLDPVLASSLGLVIQAITADPPAPEPEHEQKL